MRSIILILLMSILSGCAIAIKNVHPEWNPQGGLAAAKEKCIEIGKVARTPYLETFLPADNNTAYWGCMASYGYKAENVSKFTSHSETA